MRTRLLLPLLAVSLLVAVAAACGGKKSKAGSFTLSLSSSTASLRVGQSTTVDVLVARTSLGAPIDVTAAGLPSHVSADPLTIAAGATSGTLTIHAGATASQGVIGGITIDGTAGAATDAAPLTLVVRGLSGALDLTFGNGGVFFAPDPASFAGDGVSAIALTSGDGIAATGFRSDLSTSHPVTFELAANGAPDTGFAGGAVVTAPGAGTFRGIAVFGDRSVIVTGNDSSTGNYDLLVARYAANGTPIATFGSSGLLRVTSGINEVGRTAAESGSTLLVAGERYPAGFVSADVFVHAFDATGALITTFGSAGTAVLSANAAGRFDQPDEIERNASGSIWVFGEKNGSFGGFVAKLTAAGALDGAFNGGAVLTDPTLRIYSGEELGSGAVVVTGITPTGGGVAMSRYTSTGALDPAFGTGGHATIATPGFGAIAATVAPDGSAYLSGTVYKGGAGNVDFGVLHLLADGTLDAGFGNAGVASISFSPDVTGNFEIAQSTKIDSFGRITLGGYATGDDGMGGTSADWFALARFWP